MPALTRWMIKTSLIYFVLALLVSLLQALRPILQITWIPAGLRPVYIHLFMVGWITMLIFGVVYWMFPKFTLEKPRGNEALGWLTYFLLNAGLLLRAAAESVGQPGTGWGWALAASAILQLTAAAAFVANTWPRVKVK